VLPQAEHADVTLTMSTSAFERLLAGTLDVARATTDGTLHVDGDVRWFGALSALTTPITPPGQAAPVALEVTFDDEGIAHAG
jgi:hypothetical protein